MKNSLINTSLKEKRRHPRHHATENGIVLFQKKAGLVLDISDSGMSINVFNSEPLPSKWAINFFCAATGTKIEGLPLKLVRQEAKKLSEIGIETQTVGVIFNKPTSLQQEQIRQHISN